MGTKDDEYDYLFKGEESRCSIGWSSVLLSVIDNKTAVNISIIQFICPHFRLEFSGHWFVNLGSALFE